MITIMTTSTVDSVVVTVVITAIIPITIIIVTITLVIAVDANFITIITSSIPATSLNVLLVLSLFLLVPLLYCCRCYHY